MRVADKLGSLQPGPRSLGLSRQTSFGLSVRPLTGSHQCHLLSVRRVVGLDTRCSSASDAASVHTAPAPFSQWPNPLNRPVGNGAPQPRGWAPAQYINVPGTASGAPGVASSMLGQWVVGAAGPWLPHLGPDAQVKALTVLGRIGSDSTNDWWAEFEDTNSIYLQRMAPAQLASMVSAAAALRAPASAEWLGRVLAALESHTSVARSNHDAAECAAAVALVMHGLLSFPCIMPQADWLPRCLAAIRPHIRQLPHDSLASLAQLLACADPAALDAASATCGTALLADLTHAMCEQAAALRWRAHTGALVQLLCGLAALGQALPDPWLQRHLTSLSQKGLASLSPTQLINVLHAVMSLRAVSCPVSSTSSHWFQGWMQHVVAPTVADMAWEMSAEQSVGALCALHALGCTTTPAGGDSWEEGADGVLVRSLAYKVVAVSAVDAAQMLRQLATQMGAVIHSTECAPDVAVPPCAALSAAAELCNARMAAAAPGMAVSDVCSILCTLAACSAVSQGAVTIRPATLDSILYHSVPLLGSCGPGELTDILGALSDLGHRPSDKWQAEFMPALQLRMGVLEADQLYRVAQAVTDLGITPGQAWVVDMFGATRRCMDHLEMGRVVALAFCLSVMSPGYIDWFWARAFEEASLERLGQLGPVMLAVLIKALSDLHYRPSPAWQEAYLGAVRNRLFCPAAASTLLPPALDDARLPLPVSGSPVSSRDTPAQPPGSSQPEAASSAADDGPTTQQAPTSSSGAAASSITPVASITPGTWLGPASPLQPLAPPLPITLPWAARDCLTLPARASWARGSVDDELAGSTWSTVADAFAHATHAATHPADSSSGSSGSSSGKVIAQGVPTPSRGLQSSGSSSSTRGSEVLVGADAVTPDALVTVMDGLAYLRAQPDGEWMAAFTDAVRCQMSLLRPRHLLGVLFFCVATAYRPDAEWWADFLSAMQPQLRAMPAPDLATSLGSMHTLGVRLPHSFLAAWAAASQPRLALLLPEQLSAAVTSMASSGYTPPPAWLMMFESCTAQLAHMFDPLSLLRVVVILDRMGWKLSPEILRALYTRTAPALFDLDPPVLSQLMWALQGAAAPPEGPWVQAFISAAQRQLPRFTREQLDGVLSGLATVAAHSRVTPSHQQGTTELTDNTHDGPAMGISHHEGTDLGTQGVPAPFELSQSHLPAEFHDDDEDGYTRVRRPRVVQLGGWGDGDDAHVFVHASLSDRIANFTLIAREWMC